jgi:aromatic-L-amino-acid decarboxylase
MDCSVLFCTDMDAIRESLSLLPHYLMTPENRLARQLMDYGPALGRRFRALKLWFVFRWYGQEGLATLLERHVGLAQEFAGWVEAEPGWEVVAPHPMSTVVYRFAPAEIADEAERQRLNERLIEWINEKGRSMISHSTVRGTFALRTAVGNVRTERRHLEALWEDLRAGAADLVEGQGPGS